MISLVTTGRDDDYGYGFLNRLMKSIENNAEYLHEQNIPYEYVICEWNPPKDYLSENFKFKELFEKYNIIEIIVKNSILQKEGLNQSIFYEYFAKNCAIRHTNFDNLLLINSDIIIPKESFDEIIRLTKEGLSEDKFYRLEYRQELDLNFTIIRNESVYYPKNADGVICGYCSGDFLLVKKNAFINKGRGYDETNVNHRRISQTGMDGEILWNMYNEGMRIHLISLPYQHINHEKPNARDGYYNTNGYKNKPNWGFIDYPKKIIRENLIEIG
jgi:hypothetical protein